MVTDLAKTYKDRYLNILNPIANRLEDYLKNNISSYNIDLISTRAKGIESFLNKSNKIENGKKKYDNPLYQIQDQIGARIVAFYVSDVQNICTQVEQLFARIEKTEIIPDTVNSFGYQSMHYMFFIPEDIYTNDIDRNNCPVFFELQIATLFQHAWAQANHNLGYKQEIKLSMDQERKIAFTAAQAWGADFIFDELTRKNGKDN